MARQISSEFMQYKTAILPSHWVAVAHECGSARVHEIRKRRMKQLNIVCHPSMLLLQSSEYPPGAQLEFLLGSWGFNHHHISHQPSAISSLTIPPFTKAALIPACSFSPLEVLLVPHHDPIPSHRNIRQSKERWSFGKVCSPNQPRQLSSTSQES